MKTQNTLENKVKFFAQYFNSEAIWRTSELDENIDEVTWEFKNFKYLNETDYLELKPLSQISDEDAINLGYGYASHLKSNLDRNIDQLRKLGFAVNWMDLSVEDLVKYGWVKLKEN